jgi:hypothetical protein
MKRAARNVTLLINGSESETTMMELSSLQVQT